MTATMPRATSIAKIIPITSPALVSDEALLEEGYAVSRLRLVMIGIIAMADANAMFGSPVETALACNIAAIPVALVSALEIVSRRAMA